MNRMSTRRRLAGEGGFTLIEASIAMLLIALMFTALSAGLMGGLRATRDARLFQQATSIGEEAVEGARDLEYDTLVMQTADLTGDSRIQPGPVFDPDASGPLVVEPIVTSASGGLIFPHITTENVINTTFTTSRYVTWVDDTVQGGPARSYKRMVVIIEWQSGGQTNSYVTSSFVAHARRGLPVPKFELTPTLTQTVEVEQGNTVVFPHTILNRGIVDTYDLEIPAAENPRGWVISFYRDEGQIGTFEPAVDSLLLDTNSTGKPDTGSVGTDEIMYFLVVFDLASTEPTGTVAMTLTATSGANNTVSHDSEDTVVVGFAGLVLNLHNNPSPPVADTAAQKPLAMNLNAVTGTTLYKYSTDYYNNEPGRFIDKTNPTRDTESSSRNMANWVYQMPANTVLNGVVRVRLWVARKDFSCSGDVTLRVFLRRKLNSTTDSAEVNLAEQDYTMTPSGSGSCPFQLVEITFNVNVTLPINKWLELKVANRNSTGDAVLIAYDTTTYPSTIRLPQVSS